MQSPLESLQHTLFHLVHGYGFLLCIQLSIQCVLGELITRYGEKQARFEIGQRGANSNDKMMKNFNI
jgi:hypothetical protein